jgi:O-antigen/teichoic acid export membrane protein
MPRFLRNLGVLTIAQFVARARGLILLPILSRYLGTAEFGAWMQVSVIAFALCPLVTFGTDRAMIRLLAGLDHEIQRRRFTAWFLFCAGGAALAAAAIALGRSPLALAFFGGEGEFLRFVPLAAASFFATMLFLAANLWFAIRNDGVVLAGAVVAQAMCGLAAVLAAVATGGAVWEVIAYGVAGDLAAALGLFGLALRRGAFARPDFAILGPALRFGLPLIPAGYAMWGLNWIDRVFLVQYRTLADIGIYSAAYSIGYAVTQLFTTPLWAIYPTSAAELHNRGDRPGFDRLMRGTIGGMILVGGPAVAGLWALGGHIIVLVAGPAYAPGADVIAIVALAYLLHMLASFADVSLGLVYRQHLSTVSIAAATAVNLLLNFILIPACGILGAAIATLAGFLCQCACSWRFALQSGPFWTDLRLPAKVVAASLAMAATIAGLDRTISGTALMHVAIMVPVGIAFYLAIALPLGLVPPTVMQPLRAYVLRRPKARPQ